MSSQTLQILTSIAWSVPANIVAIVGIVLAIQRWQRHPAVSALLVASLATMLFSWLAYRMAVPILVARRGGPSIDRMNLVLGTLGILMALVRTMCWGALIVAVFGWRQGPDDLPTAPLQFSIRGLIAVTFAVAVLCGLGRWFVGILGETAPVLIQFIDDLPLVICLGIGIWIAATRWSRHPWVSFLAVWSFALGIAVTLVPQTIFLIALQSSIRSDGFFLLIQLMATIATTTYLAMAIAAALGWREHCDQMRHSL